MKSRTRVARRTSAHATRLTKRICPTSSSHMARLQQAPTARIAHRDRRAPWTVAQDSPAAPGLHAEPESAATRARLDGHQAQRAADDTLDRGSAHASGSATRQHSTLQTSSSRQAFRSLANEYRRAAPAHAQPPTLAARHDVETAPASNIRTSAHRTSEGASMRATATP